jgi:hypothetical protein
MARPKGDKPAKPKTPRKPKAPKNAKAAGPAPNLEAPAAPAQEPPRVHGNTVFTVELGLQITELIAESKTLNQALKALGNPVHRATVFRWLDENEDFRKQYARAHSLQAETDADEIREITRRVIGPLNEGETAIPAADARVAIDALKWAASKRNPKRYGEKVEVDTPADGNIATAVAVTMTALAALARKPETE